MACRPCRLAFTKTFLKIGPLDIVEISIRFELRAIVVPQVSDT